MDESQPKVSDSTAALREIVDVSVPLKSARWEIYGTPEYTGGVPGPTDYITLIAELELADQGWFGKQPNVAASTYITPEAARAWLSGPFQTLLKQNRNSTIELPGAYNCRKYSSRLKKTGNPVNGFVCQVNDKTLLYLALSQTT